MKDQSKPAKQPGKNGFQYKPQWGVIIICKGEEHQAQMYAQCKADGHQVKVVTV